MMLKDQVAIVILRIESVISSSSVEMKRM